MFLFFIVIVAITLFTPDILKTRKTLTKLLYINEDIKEVNFEEKDEQVIDSPEDFLDDDPVMDSDEAKRDAEELLRQIYEKS